MSDPVLPSTQSCRQSDEGGMELAEQRKGRLHSIVSVCSRRDAEEDSLMTRLRWKAGQFREE